MSVGRESSATFEVIEQLREQLRRAEARCTQLEAELVEARQGQQQLQRYARDFRRTYSEARQRLQQMTALYEISTAISGTVDPTEVTARTIAGLQQLLPGDAVALYVTEVDPRELRRLAFATAELPVELPEVVYLGVGALGRRLAAGESVLNDPTLAAAVAPGAIGIQALPLIAGTQRLGWLLALRFSLQPFTDDEQRLVEMVASQAAMALQNARLATTDALTGLYNRRHFEQTLAFECDRARRSGRPLGLLILDVDFFKRFNERYGHPAGDAVLRAVAATLSGGLRRTDILARIGGEEFAAILPEEDLERVSFAAERLRRFVERQPGLRFEGADLPAIRISVGGTSLQGDLLEPAALIMAADSALRIAKRGGRNRSVVVEPPGSSGTDGRESSLPTTGYPDKV